MYACVGAYSQKLVYSFISIRQVKLLTRAFLILFLRFFKEDVLAERRIKLHKLNLTFHSLLILAGPDNVAGLRGFKT